MKFIATLIQETHFKHLRAEHVVSQRPKGVEQRAPEFWQSQQTTNKYVLKINTQYLQLPGFLHYCESVYLRRNLKPKF